MDVLICICEGPGLTLETRIRSSHVSAAVFVATLKYDTYTLVA